MEKAKYITKKIIKLCFIIILSIIVYQFYFYLKEQTNTKEIVPSYQKNGRQINSITDVLANNFNSVVGVSKLKENGNSVFLMNASEELGLGTGMIVSKKGYILTNEHVSGDTSCYITLPEGNVTKGKVVWSDETSDLSIVKINENVKNSIEFGNSDQIAIGETVYAIGNPIGYEFQRTVTKGIISALNRTIKLKEKEDYLYMSNLIQTDATINPGNSGGPLINEKGEVIGINSIKITSADGIGFAIPINVIRPIVAKLEKTGEFKEAYLGVFAYDSSVIPYLKGSTNITQGVYVEKIDKEGSAEGTELNVGDVIIKIDNQDIFTMSDLQEYIYSKKPGDEVSLQIHRDGKIKNISIILEERKK